MDEFIMSPHFGSICLILMIILGIAYAVIVTVEALIDEEFDPVIEAKCKKCICYDMCKKHGCDYNCKDYMTEEMLQSIGMNKEDMP